MDRIMFERFLDNLEIYLDLRNGYRRKAKKKYEGGQDYMIVEEELEPERDVIENQIDILQGLFENMVGDKDGNV